MRPFYRKDLFRDEIIKITPKELKVRAEKDNKKLSILKMEKGQSITLNSEEYETGLIFLSGTASIKTGEFEFKDKGSRKDVFSGAPAAVYIPKNTEYTITATGYGQMEMALCMLKTEGNEKVSPFMIESEAVQTQYKGVFNWKREVHEIFTAENTEKGCHLCIGEIYGCPGSWATYPYTKEPKETVFFFKILPNQGKKVQVMGSEEKDDLYYVNSESAIIVSEEYMPIAKVEGCKIYCLWFKEK